MLAWREPRYLTRSQRATRRVERRLALLLATVLVSALVVVTIVAPGRDDVVVITMYMQKDCSRCERYADYLRARNFKVVVADEPLTSALRAEYRLPRGIPTTPLGLVRGKFVLGHVPAEDIRDLIAQPGEALGLIVPGAPPSAPGIRSALPRQFTVYRVFPGGLMTPVNTYNHSIHFW